MYTKTFTVRTQQGAGQMIAKIWQVEGVNGDMMYRETVFPEKRSFTAFSTGDSSQLWGVASPVSLFSPRV